MYLEYAIYDKEYNADVKKNVFEALDYVHGLSIPSIFLTDIHDFLPHGITLSCPIDWPNGWSDTKIRAHETVKAIHKGANAIDLVANVIAFVNNKPKAFVEDIKVQKSICDENNVSLRVMTDYRKINDMEQFRKMWSLLKEAGVEYGFGSTGIYTDDHLDIISLCGIIQQNYAINMICNGNIYLPEQFEQVKKSEPFGIRFTNVNAIKRCISK